ncbi:MAG: hypothetical protein V3R14_01630, partial [Nitrospinaceae bacterium]
MRKKLTLFLFILFSSLVLGNSCVWAYDINPSIFSDLKQGGKYLNMKRSGILGDEGIKKLAKSRMIKKVETLILEIHDITDEGAK